MVLSSAGMSIRGAMERVCIRESVEASTGKEFTVSEKNSDSLAARILQSSQKRTLENLEKSAWKLTKIAAVAAVVVGLLVLWFTHDSWKAALPVATLAVYVAATWVNYFLMQRRVLNGTFGSSLDDVAEIKKHLANDKEP